MTSLPAPAARPRDFATYLASLTATAVGDAVAFVALPFVVLSSGGGQAALGAVVLSASLPRFLAPLLGTLADRWPPRAVLGVSALLRAALLATVALLALRESAPLPVLAAFAFLNGLLVTLSFTAGSALTPRLVAPEGLARANSLTSAALMGLPLVGYGLGGLLVKALGSAETLLVALPLYALSALAPALLKPLAPGGAQTGAGFWSQLRGGLSVVRASPPLLVMLLLGFAMNLTLNVVNVLAPLFMQRGAGGAGGYALFEGLLSGGALLGALAVGPLARRWSADRLIGLGRGLCALAVLGLAAPQPAVWFAAAGLLGLSLGLLEVAALTRIQSLAPQVTLGRVMGVFLGLNALGLSAGAALGGGHWSGPWLFAALAALLAALGLLQDAFTRRPAA